MTEWLPVVGYEGLYCVSAEGQVRSLPRNTTRGGLLKLQPDRHGYPYVNLTRDGAQKRYAVHLLVAAAFLGPRPPGQEVRHDDGNPANASAANLLYGTHAENMRDKARHGSDHNLAKTHCPAGHPYDEANTRVYQGRRFCRECSRDRSGYKGNPLPGDRTHCPQGHPYDDANTYRAPSGNKRQCRTCLAARRLAAKAAHQ